MGNLYKIILLVLLATLPSHKAKAGNILVFAASSTSHVVNELVEVYRQQGGGKVRASFASSSVLAKQIYAGAPAHIYISANQQWMSFLEQGGALEKGSRFNLVGNSLVLIAPSSSTLNFDNQTLVHLPRLIGKERIALGDPDHVPAGIYAKQALEKLGIWEVMESKIVRMPHARAALVMVERGEVAAGIVYGTDAAIGNNIKVLATFPPHSHQAISYPVALVKGNNTPEALKFITFLKSPKAHNLFTKHGFLVSN